MKRKPPIFQVRISPELAAEVESMRAGFTARISRPAFVEMLIRSGMVAHKTVDKLNALDHYGDSAASSLSK